MTAEMSAHAMAMQGRHGKIDFTLLRRGDLLQELASSLPKLAHRDGHFRQKIGDPRVRCPFWPRSGSDQEQSLPRSSAVGKMIAALDEAVVVGCTASVRCAPPGRRR